MDWKMTAGGLTPPELLVSEDLINMTDEQIDENLPEGYKEIGCIIYTADFSKVKQKDFDGSWKEASGGSSPSPTPSGNGVLIFKDSTTREVKWEGTEEELHTHEVAKNFYGDVGSELDFDEFYKVSDLAFSEDELIGKEYHMQYSGEFQPSTYTVNADSFWDYVSNGEVKAYVVDGVFLAAKEAGVFVIGENNEEFVDCVEVPSPGVYVLGDVSLFELSGNHTPAYIEADGKDVTGNIAQTLKPAIKVEDALKITWDGNTQGLSHTNVIHVEDEGVYVSAYRVADIPSDFAIEKLVPFHSVVINFNGEEQVGVDITDIEQLSEIEINDDFIILDDASIIMLNPGTYPLGFGDMTFESAGFYFLGISMENPPESLLTYGSKFISDVKKVSINPLLQSVSFEIYQTNQGEEEDPEWKARYNGATLSNEEAYNIASYCFEHFIPFNTYVKNQWGKTRQCGTFTYVSNDDEQSITASVNVGDYQLVIYPEEIYFSEK